MKIYMNLDEELERLGNKIKFFRINNSFTQEELAISAGISRTYLSQIENGKRCPTLRTLVDIANVLDLSYLGDVFI